MLETDSDLALFLFILENSYYYISLERLLFYFIFYSNLLQKLASLSKKNLQKGFAEEKHVRDRAVIRHHHPAVCGPVRQECHISLAQGEKNNP